MPRDDNREKLFTTNNDLPELLDKRGLRRVRHFSTPKLVSPTSAQRRRIRVTRHIWTTGDTLMKLAHQNYGSVAYWYVIAWYNFKPTDAHFELGDPVYIPANLQQVLSIFRSY
jgi:nucleoid-associated protein YgaU